MSGGTPADGSGNPSGGTFVDAPAGTSAEVTSWWRTAVSRIAPGEIELRGYPVEQLIGRAGFVETIWLLLRGELPEPGHAALLEAALVASVDHGPQAPSIAAARMAATCGIGLNSAVATGVNMLGDIHGGAGEQCMELLDEILRREDEGTEVENAVGEVIGSYRAAGSYVPGFGHRFHPRDPRRDPLLALVGVAATEGLVSGRHLRIAESVERQLASGASGSVPVNRPVPMNIDGATAVVFCELGFPPALGRGLFVLARSVGILAHAWEEQSGGARIKGPLPRDLLPDYVGPARRDLDR